MKDEKRARLKRFFVTMVAAWVVGTCAYTYFSPWFVYHRLKKVVVERGFGIPREDGSTGIPINTLFVMPVLATPSASESSLVVTGTNQDTLYAAGCLDLSKGPLVLHVPDMTDRYYAAVQFVNSWGEVLAYVGRRTTGTRAGDYLITGPGRQADVPSGMEQIVSPDDSLLVIGRVLVRDAGELQTVYELPSRSSSVRCRTPSSQATRRQRHKRRRVTRRQLDADHTGRPPTAGVVSWLVAKYSQARNPNHVVRQALSPL